MTDPHQERQPPEAHVPGERGMTPASIGASDTLKHAHVWEVAAPLPLGRRGRPSFLGHLAPIRRRRRLNVEVHRARSVFDSARTAAPDDARHLPEDMETCCVRILKRVRGRGWDLEPLARKLQGDARKATQGTVHFLTGAQREKAEDDEDSDDDSVMESFRERSLVNDEGGASTRDAWRPRYKIPLRMFRIVERKGCAVLVAVEEKGRVAHREYVFDDEPALSDFCAIVDTNKKLSDGRLQARLDVMLRGIHLKEGEALTLLFDICSGSNLPQSDVGKESDPYVSVRFNGEKIHKTDVIPSNANPIWTLQSGALFIWKVGALELFQSEVGLVFEVKDHDSIGSNDSLGAFSIHARTLYKWDGERREFALTPLLGERDYKRGSIALRLRRATTHDVEFMDKFHRNRAPARNAAAVPNTKAAGTLKTMVTRYSKKERKGPEKGKTKYRVRPGPDPECEEETSWLTKEKIEEEARKPSRRWIDIGSGNLGKVFVEIIGCDKLPNLDASILGDKTDAFVSVVYEDCCARTDTVDNSLSPRWMPWTQRAFVFNMMHTSSQLFLAVFDMDAQSSHDFVGRVSVDISNLRPSLTYLLQYNLHRTANHGPRTAKHGKITIRLRLELKDERSLLLSNFQLPQSVYVNVDKKKDFRVIKQTVEGDVDMKKYQLSTIYKYHDELWAYLTIFYALKNALLSVILWRGYSIVSLPVPSFASRSVKWVNLRFPLNSVVAFISITSLVENPNLLPSFCFGCVGWLLIFSHEKRSTSPNPWYRCKSFFHFLSALLHPRGESLFAPEPIQLDESEAKKASLDSWDKRLEEAEIKVREREEKYAKEQEQYFKDLEEIGDIDEALDSENHGVLSSLMSSVDGRAWLFPIQQYLRVVCLGLRVLTNILSWQECYLSFWVAACSFILSVVSMFVPWGFLAFWTLRTIAWVGLGPWMKLVDIYYFSSTVESGSQKRVRTKQHDEWLAKQKLDAQITREKTAKLKDFKKWMFGKYICQVNVLKKDRYYDLPLPTSSAILYNTTSESLDDHGKPEVVHEYARVDGQQLVGDMIPRIHETTKTEALSKITATKSDLSRKKEN